MSKYSNGNYILGLDCSKYQGNINWTKVKDDGVQFAFIKITEGGTYSEDEIYNIKTRVIMAKGAGVKIGYYHFARPGDFNDPKKDAIQEIENVKKHLALLPSFNFPPTLDIEAYAKNCVLKGKALNINIFINTFLDQFNEVIILYTGKYFFDPNSNHTYGMNPLWLAAYTSKPVLPKGWNEWKIWQFTDKGQIDGIPGFVDLNWMQVEYFNLFN
jgi:lysozyme